MPPSEKRKVSAGAAPGNATVRPIRVPRSPDLSDRARQRAIARRFAETHAEWEHTCESAFGTFEDWPQRCRLQQAFAFWPGVGCELCACFQDYAAAQEHALEDCSRWAEAERARYLLHCFDAVAVAPAPEAKAGAIDEDDDVCVACGFASTPCRVDRRAGAPGADCRNVGMARRAVAALLAFEDGVLHGGLVEPWAESDDVVAMMAYMAGQRETDRSYVPGFLQALDDLYGSYQFLIQDYDYRVNLRRRGRGSENVAALVRCGGGKIWFLKDELDEEVAAKKESVAAIEKQLDEREEDDSEDDSEDDLDDKLYQLQFDIELLEQYYPITTRLTLLQRLLLLCRDVCIVCKAAGRQSNHSIRTCADEKSRNAQAELLWAEKAIHFNRNLGCLRCGVPSEICTRWKEKKRGKELFHLINLPGRCCFEGVALETIYGIKYGYHDIWNAWVNRLEEKSVGMRPTLGLEEAGKNLTIYLGKKNEDKLVRERFTEPGSNNLIWEFEWMALAVEERWRATVK